MVLRASVSRLPDLRHAGADLSAAARRSDMSDGRIVFHHPAQIRYEVGASDPVFGCKGIGPHHVVPSQGFHLLGKGARVVPNKMRPLRCKIECDGKASEKIAAAWTREDKVEVQSTKFPRCSRAKSCSRARPRNIGAEREVRLPPHLDKVPG